MNIYYCVFILLFVFSFVEVLNNGKYRNTPIYGFFAIFVKLVRIISAMNIIMILSTNMKIKYAVIINPTKVA